MIYTLEWLCTKAQQTQREVNGRWVPARPISNTFRWESLRAAWEVYRGRADAFTWPEQQQDDSSGGPT